MKKFLIGCGVVTLLVIVLFVGVLVFIGVKAKQTMAAYEQAADKVHQVQVDYPFDPPEDLAMSPDRFEAYLNVRDRTIDRFTQIGVVSEMIAASQEKRKPDVSAGDMIGLISKFPPAIEDIAQILRTDEMSPAEYGYYSHTTLVTIKRAADDGNEEMADLWENLMEMADGIDSELRNNQNANVNVDLDRALRKIEGLQVPDQNVQLILQPREELESKPMAIMLELVIQEAYQDWQRQQRSAARQQGSGDLEPAGEPVPAQ